MIDYTELSKALRNCSNMNECCRECRYLQTTDRSCKLEMMKDAAEAIEELSNTKVEKWISVKDRFPAEKAEHYLCLFDDGSIGVCYWLWMGLEANLTRNRARITEYDFYPDYKKVTHWMPLPQPPKEESKQYSNVIEKSGGPYSLYCTSCHRWIPNTANAEMRKEGVFSHSHFCCNGVNLTPNDGGIDDIEEGQELIE